jgi:hypothetical protein
VAHQVYVMLRGHHKAGGYLAFFNYYTLAWALLRTLYWTGFAADAPFVTQTSAGSYLLFFLPLFFQYLTFSLLATFLIKFVVGASAWTAGVRSRTRLVTWSLAAASLMGSVLAALLSSLVDDSYYTWWLLGNAILFLLLSLVFAGLSVALRGVPEGEFSRMLLKRRSLRLVTATTTLVFASRSIYNFLSFAGVVVIDINRDDVSTDVACAVMYGVWEFFPLVLLLSTLAAPPTVRGGGGGSEGVMRMPTFGVFGAIAALEQGGGADGEEPLLGGDAGAGGSHGGGGGGGGSSGGGGSGGGGGGGAGSSFGEHFASSSGALRRGPSSGALSDGSGSLGGSRQRMSHLNLTPLASPQLASLGGGTLPHTPLVGGLSTPQLGGARGPSGVSISGAPFSALPFDVGPLQAPVGGLGVAGGVLFSGANLAAFARGGGATGAPYGSPSWMVSHRVAEEDDN